MTPVETPLPAHRRAGRGPGVLLLHAFPFSKEMWAEQVVDLSRDHLVVAPDFPGFGDTPPLAEHETTVARYAEAAEAVAASAASGPWVAIGLSMGGYVAFELVRRARLRLRGLVLCDTRAPADSPATRAARIALASQVRVRGAEAVAETHIDKMVTPSCPPDVRRRVDAWMRGASREGLLGAIHALLERPDSTSTLARIEVPTLAIVGEHDSISPPEEMDRMAAAISGGGITQIPAASHLSNVEAPAPFAKALRKFLSSIERPPV